MLGKIQRKNKIKNINISLKRHNFQMTLLNSIFEEVAILINFYNLSRIKMNKEQNNRNYLKLFLQFGNLNKN